MGKKITITEKRLREIIDGAIKEAVNNILYEGVDFDYENHIVSYNPLHQNNVDTSLQHNPSVSKEYGVDVNVWSLLKRKNGSPLDGNPLLYAMKGEQDWKFRNDVDYQELVKQINRIVAKFSTIYSGGISILLPSGNHLNKWVADIVGQHIPSIKLLDDVLVKLTTEEVEEIVMEKKSPFHQFYKGNMESALRELEFYFKQMFKQRKDDYFVRHMIKNNTMRNVIDRTLRLSDSAYAKYANYINGQDILLIDDSISRGQTIKEAIEIIKTSYSPKSISVLTLFSKKY